jgi:hypothetical protein
MDRLQARVAGALLAIALGGCGVYPLKQSQIETRLDQMTAPIAVGKVDRVAVRRFLGEPYLSSEYWRFDLFRITDSSKEILVLLIPIPQEYVDIGYVLVTYGADGGVSAFDSGATLDKPQSWAQPNLVLQAGTVGFAAEPAARILRPTGSDTEAAGQTLFVAGGPRDEYLEMVSNASHCTVLTGCQAGQTCTNSLFVDDGEARAMPGSLAAPSRTPDERGDYPQVVWNWLVPLSLPPGMHSIQTFVDRKPFASASFECAAGELLYLWIDQPMRLSRDSPAGLQEQPLLIYRDGVWLVPNEPER